MHKSASVRVKEEKIPTYVLVPLGELFAYEGGCIKNHLQTREEETHFLVPLWHVLQAYLGSLVFGSSTKGTLL